MKKCHNGNGKYYSANQDIFIVNVPKTSHNAVFDPINSFLRFKLTMPASITANASGSIQGECGTIFQRLEVFCGSDLLETINNYDQIDSYFVDSLPDISDMSDKEKAKVRESLLIIIDESKRHSYLFNQLVQMVFERGEDNY